MNCTCLAMNAKIYANSKSFSFLAIIIRSVIMRWGVICLGLMLFFHSLVLSGDDQTINWLNGSLEEIKSQAQLQNKDIVIYVYADWCSICTYTKENLLNQEEIINLINENFLAYQVEDNSIEAKEIMSQYRVSGYPTFLFIRPDSYEIDRIVGGRPKDNFIESINNIINNIKTLEYYTELMETEPNNTLWKFKILVEYAERADIEKVLYYSDLIKKTDFEYYNQQQDFILYIIGMVHTKLRDFDKAIATYQQIVENSTNEEFIKKAYRELSFCYMVQNKIIESYDILKLLVDRYPEDITSYMSIAGLADKFDYKIDETIVIVLEGLELDAEVKNKAYLYFLLARLYEKKNLIQNALEMVERAIELDQQEYYTEYRDYLELK